jgi:hypothetical protein
MRPVSDPQTTSAVLRLLIDDPDVSPLEFEWSGVRALAERNDLMVRLADRFQRRGWTMPVRFAEAVARKRYRAPEIVAVLARVSEACEKHRIMHTWLDLAQEVPDFGRNLNLLISADTAADDVLLSHVSAVPGRLYLRNRLAGTTLYTLPDSGAVIALHHGRLGFLGEHRQFASLVLRNRHWIPVRGVPCFVPAIEDQVLLQALRYFRPRPRIRLGNLAWVISALRAGRINWNSLVATACSTRLLPALSCHMIYIDQIHKELSGLPLLTRDMRSGLVLRRWGSVAFDAGSFRAPGSRVTARLYADELHRDLRAGDWDAVARLSLLPIVALSIGWRRVRNVPLLR